MNSFISILMPVYNGEAYLKAAIDSVLNQTYKEFEFLIINDGSTDKSQAIIDSYADARIRCLQQVNAGVAAALNKGLSLAKGTYIWRHDADDICLTEQLETQLKFLEAHPEFSLVSTQVAFMTDKGKIAYQYKQPKDAYFQGEDFIKVESKHFNPYSPITHATVLVRKEVFDEIGNYRTHFKTSEDTDLWLRIIEKFDAAVLHYCSYFVRLNTTSATQVYKKTNTFYRDLAFAFADERVQKGTDQLQRDEAMPHPDLDQEEYVVKQSNKKGHNFRADILNYRYKVALNAKDYTNIIKDIKYALKDGWGLKATYRAILFPILGETLVEKGVRIKKKIKI